MSLENKLKTWFCLYAVIRQNLVRSAGYTKDHWRERTVVELLLYTLTVLIHHNELDALVLGVGWLASQFLKTCLK